MSARRKIATIQMVVHLIGHSFVGQENVFLLVLPLMIINRIRVTVHLSLVLANLHIVVQMDTVRKTATSVLLSSFVIIMNQSAVTMVLAKGEIFIRVDSGDGAV